MESTAGHDSSTVEVRRGFKLVFQAIQLSWGRVFKRVFQFHVCGRLVSLRDSNVIVEQFVHSVEKCTPKPYLHPVSSFFPELDSSQMMEIPAGDYCRCVSCSPCGIYIAAGTGRDIAILKTSNVEISRLFSGTHWSGQLHTVLRRVRENSIRVLGWEGYGVAVGAV